jgi:hypothetical protein
MFDWERFAASLLPHSGWERKKERDYQGFKKRLIAETNLRESGTPEEWNKFKDEMVVKK